MDASRKALHTRNVDRTKDLNDLEIGFIAGIIDHASSITCAQSGKLTKKRLHWMLRVHSKSANLIATLRIMTGVGEFLESPERKYVFWTVGIMDGYFLLLKLNEALQMKHDQTMTMIKYREASLISKVEQKKYVTTIRKQNAAKNVTIKGMNDMAFLGYFLGVLETRATAMMMSNGPFISMGPLPNQIQRQIIERIGGTTYGNDVIWHGNDEFNFLYDLTKGKLFSFNEPMDVLKQFVGGKMNPYAYEQVRETPQKYDKIDIKKMMPKIDEMAKELNNT